MKIDILSLSIVLSLLGFVFGDEEKVACHTIGIDFGTTYSCAAVYFEEKGIEMVPSELNNNCIPSIVAFSNTKGRLVGDAARLQASTNPSNTIFRVKRVIGR